MLVNLGYAVAIISAVLGIAALGGGVVYRWKSGGEKEAIGAYRNAVGGYKEEVAALTLTNERLEVRVGEQDRVIASQGEQIKMLSRMVTGVEAIGNLERHIDGKFGALHTHMNRLWGDDAAPVKSS